MAKDDPATDGDALAEQERAVAQLPEIVAPLAAPLDRDKGRLLRRGCSRVVRDPLSHRHAGQEEAGAREEDGREEEAVVVAKARDCARTIVASRPAVEEAGASGEGNVLAAEDAKAPDVPATS